MRSLKVLVIVPAWFALIAAASPAPTTPSPTPPPPSPSPSPVPTPSPTHAFITLDTAAGGPNTVIGVSGSLFPAGVTVSLYWDTSNKVAGSTNTDGNGNLATHVKPFPGDGPGQHTICGSAGGLNQAPPCAGFTLQGPPTPTPAASPSPSPSPSPSESPSPSASTSASASRLTLTTGSGRGGLDVITKPPFVFLPIIGLLALLAAIAYWLLMRVDRTPVLPAASVVHRSSRPDIGPPGPGMAPPPTPPVEPSPPEPPPN